jgi:oligopeptide transport system ATP-binding protein
MTEATPPLMQVEDLVVSFPAARRQPGEPPRFRAVDRASLEIRAGEVVALVGESGSGKTTLGKAMLRLYQPDAGRVVFSGREITRMGERELRPMRRALQMIFQDPLSSFNPRVRIGEALALPLRLHRLCARGDIDGEVDRLLTRVGLSPMFRARYPHEMSGGQLQRVAIARALAMRPSLVVADEAVSKLDVSVRAQILNLFRSIQRETGVALLFITHDLRVARYLADRIGVMFFGRIVEIGPTTAMFDAPKHPYTHELLGTVKGDQQTVTEPAPPADPSGCRYRSRCPHAMAICSSEVPRMRILEGRAVACHREELQHAGVRGGA